MCARCMEVPAVYSRRDAGMESFIMKRRTYLLHALMFVLMIRGPPKASLSKGLFRVPM